MNIANISNIIGPTINNPDINEIKYVLKFDGCSKGNPGPAGAGAVLYYNDIEVWSAKEYVGIKETNNYAEYTGLLIGLREAEKRNIKYLIVKGDSQLVIRQMKGEYKVKSENLVLLYNESKKISTTFDKIIFEHIYRKFNSRADELSNQALENNI